jgi:hypothetical protein
MGGIIGGATNLGVGTDIQWWVCVKCKRPTRAWLGGQEPMLNLFLGGPLDGSAYETETLITHAVDIKNYVWTPDTRVSTSTGATARVWLHKDVTQDSVGGHPSTEMHTGESSEQEHNTTGGMPIMSDSLLERRKALKLSRSVVASKAGVTVAQLARIEAGGKKNSQEEISSVSAALDGFTPSDPS